MTISQNSYIIRMCATLNFRVFKFIPSVIFSTFIDILKILSRWQHLMYIVNRGVITALSLNYN